jgi:type II secretory pathway pseudopilin PulG
MAGFASQRRGGLTLVELLVVIGIIGALLAMIIPAVQAVREAGRRAQCQNNLKQLAVAVHQFHDTHNRFPPGQCGGNYKFGPDSVAWSWLARILPHIEQDALYQQGGVPSKTLKASGIADRQIPLFLCPSDSFSHVGPRIDAGNLDGFAVGQTNYKGVSGANWGADGSQKLDNIGTAWRNEGVNGSYDGYDNGDGILWRSDVRQRIGMRNVVDGLSRTLLIGEDLPGKNRWCSWPYANNAYGTCAIPPNSTWDDANWWPNTHSFRSVHSGGLFFALADGSVQFVREDISPGIYRALATRAGKERTEEF